MSTTLSATKTANHRETVDRWFFTAMAVLLLVIAVVGFMPNSIAIISGSKANPALAVHVHAFAMFFWLILFVAQASLIGLGKPRVHAQLGKLLFLLGPVIALLMVYLAITRFPGGERGPIVAASQTERVVLWTSFLIGAIVTRKRDGSAHKRLILLATTVPMSAALNRMPWLPDFGLGWSTPVWMLAIVAPLFAYDLFRFGRLHKVTAIGGGLIAIYWIAMIIWDSMR